MNIEEAINAARQEGWEMGMKEAIEVDISSLEVNGNIRVEDVKVENMEIMNHIQSR